MTLQFKGTCGCPQSSIFGFIPVYFADVLYTM